MLKFNAPFKVYHDGTVYNLNTSHVKVQLYKYIISFTNIYYLNTSHVKVQLNPAKGRKFNPEFKYISC